MKNHLFKLLALFLLLCGAAQARDGFESVRCGADVPRALVGNRMSDEPVVKIEGRHIALALKDLGGEEISDRFNSTSWSICGKEYMVLSDTRGIVRDVLAIPSHYRTSPEFTGGTCQANGRRVAGPIVAVLDNRAEGVAVVPPTILHKTGLSFRPLPHGRSTRMSENLSRFPLMGSLAREAESSRRMAAHSDLR